MFDCNYEMRALWQTSSIYTCTARVVFLGDTHELIDVSHNHLTGYTNADVKGLFIPGQPLSVVPRNISNFFPNLESLYLSNLDVTEVTNTDLFGLGNLKVFVLVAAKLSSIESNLFVNNPLLHSISFNDNPIRHIGHRVFDSLVNLTILDFQINFCINEGSSNRTTTEALIFSLIVNCPPSFEMTETKILNGAGLLDQIDHRVANITDPMLSMLLKLEERVVVLEQQGWIPSLPYHGQLIKMLMKYIFVADKNLFEFFFLFSFFCRVWSEKKVWWKNFFPLLHAPMACG